MFACLLISKCYNSFRTTPSKSHHNPTATISGAMNTRRAGMSRGLHCFEIVKLRELRDTSAATILRVSLSFERYDLGKAVYFQGRR